MQIQFRYLYRVEVILQDGLKLDQLFCNHDFTASQCHWVYFRSHTETR